MSHLHTAVLSLSIELDDLREISGVSSVVMDRSEQDREICPEGLPEGTGPEEDSVDGRVGDREQVVGTSIGGGDFDTAPGFAMA
jgi:hypothetical protein